jgi:hypothetical protein
LLEHIAAFGKPVILALVWIPLEVQSCGYLWRHKVLLHCCTYTNLYQRPFILVTFWGYGRPRRFSDKVLAYLIILCKCVFSRGLLLHSSVFFTNLLLASWLGWHFYYWMMKTQASTVGMMKKNSIKYS